MAGCRQGCRDADDCWGVDVCRVDTWTCGRCDTDEQCPGELDRCVNGGCVPGCAGHEDCADDEATPVCGEAGLCVQCIEGDRCRDGACARGWTPCEGGCVNAGQDPANCGGCSIACEANVECVSGACGPVQEEAEPNDAAAQCQRVATADWRVNGAVSPAGDHDWYCFRARAGQTLTFDINTERRSPLDSYLRVHSLEPEPALIAENDDESRWQDDSLLRHAFEVTGEYAVEISAYEEGGGDNHRYELRIR